MDHALQQALAALNAQLETTGISAYKLGVAAPNELKLLEELDGRANARFMTKETFDVLVEGVSRTGLSSMPFCYFDGTDQIVLSGNHRVKAARSAGVPKVLFLYTDREMSREEQIAVQLAHNQVTGQDDPQVLKQLWGEISDLGLKYLTGFDDEFFEKLRPVEFAPIKEAALMQKQVVFLFLGEDMGKIAEAAELIEKIKAKEPVLLARFQDFDLFFEAVMQTKEKLGIVNTATAIRKMAEMTLEALAEPSSDAKGRVN
ncbi:hypothetical protein [Desulfarculus baarsii]